MVSTSDTSGTMRQKQVEPIIIRDADDTGCDETTNFQQKIAALLYF